MSPKPEKDQRGTGRAVEMVAVVALTLSFIAAGTALASRSPNSTRVSRPVPIAVSTARCVNSFDPACGPLHWVPAPGPNQPTTTSLSPETARSTVGHAVSFAARANDPDASIACHWVLFGDEQAGLIPALSMQRQ